MNKFEPFWNQEIQERFRTPGNTNDYCQISLEEFTENRGLGSDFIKDVARVLPEGCFIAGGSCGHLIGEREDIKDVDIFFNSSQALEGFLDSIEYGELEVFKGYRTDYSYSEETKNVRLITYYHESKPTIQLIKTMWYESMEDLIDTFDFTISQVATDGKTVVMNPMAPVDLNRKRLVINRVTFSASTMGRLVKYAKRGFYACPGALQVLANAIRETPVDDEEYMYID